MMKTRRNLALRAGLAALVASAGVLGGCRGDRSDKPPRQFFPDMDDGPVWKPQTESEFYANHRTMRQPPEGAVAFARSDFDPDAYASEAWASAFLAERAGLLKSDDAFYRGVDATGAWVDEIPASVDVTTELIEHGRLKFDIYCATCHGIFGDGQGLVGVRWSIPVASFHDEKFRDRSQETGKDGDIFDIARHGKGEGAAMTMPAYSHAIDEFDAWAIVAYIRALQQSRNGGGGS